MSASDFLRLDHQGSQLKEKVDHVEQLTRVGCAISIIKHNCSVLYANVTQVGNGIQFEYWSND